MKGILVATALASTMLLTGLVSGTELQEHVAVSRAAVKTMQGQLQQELQTAMKTGGPVHAISVCKDRAPKIAADVSRASGLSIGRTSLKLRNPANAPDAWEQTVLQLFELRMKNGESAENIDYYEITTKNEKRELRYMKAIAIPEQAPCLVCHGEKIDAAVTTKLKQSYPADRATGFRSGDLRGAFTVRKPL